MITYTKNATVKLSKKKNSFTMVDMTSRGQITPLRVGAIIRSYQTIILYDILIIFMQQNLLNSNRYTIIRTVTKKTGINIL